MKLKKIASLMLAGVMAVSMLAGCGESSSSSSSEPTTPPVTTTGLAAALNDARTKYAKEIGLTYEEDSTLASILSTVAHDKFDKDPTTLETLAGANSFGGVYHYNNADSNIDASAEWDKISDKLIGGVTDWNNAGNSLNKSGTFNYMTLYTVGGNYSIEEVGNMIAKAHVNDIEVAKWLPLRNASDTYTADYTADVASVKVTSADDSTVSLWVVAVVYTQTVSDAK